MGTDFRDILDAMPPARRKRIMEEADRLEAEYIRAALIHAEGCGISTKSKDQIKHSVQKARK